MFDRMGGSCSNEETLNVIWREQGRALFLRWHYRIIGIGIGIDVVQQLKGEER